MTFMIFVVNVLMMLCFANFCFAQQSKARCAALDFCNFRGTCNTQRFFCECQAGFTGVTCKNPPAEIFPGTKVPGGVIGTGSAFFHLKDFRTRQRINVQASSGAVNVYAAVGYVPTANRLQFADDSVEANKVLVVSTDIPDINSVQDLHLYITVQGKVDEATADFVVWIEPGESVSAVFPRLQSWAGALVLILLICVCCCAVLLAYVAIAKPPAVQSSFRAWTGGDANNDYMTPMAADQQQTQYNAESADVSMVPLHQDPTLAQQQVRTAPSMVSLDQYTTAVDGNLGQFPCSVCQQRYNSQYDLQVHQEKRGHNDPSGYTMTTYNQQGAAYDGTPQMGYEAPTDSIQMADPYGLTENDVMPMQSYNESYVMDGGETDMKSLF